MPQEDGRLVAAVIDPNGVNVIPPTPHKKDCHRAWTGMWDDLCDGCHYDHAIQTLLGCQIYEPTPVLFDGIPVKKKQKEGRDGTERTR